MRKNQQWILTKRPEGRLTEADLQLRETDVPLTSHEQVLVRNVYLSLDPANRGWANERDTYVPAVPLGQPMRGLTIGVVEESNSALFQQGDIVQGMGGWQNYWVSAHRGLTKIPRSEDLPLTAHFGIFGHIGATAYFGLVDVGRPRKGETLVVSAAAGAVGSLVGQIGKILGCHVVGTAGTAEKCEWLLEIGFDAAINYKEGDLKEQLKQNCPEGVDVYFDNVGGATLDAALSLINDRARVVVCGLISQYNATEPVPGPFNFPNILIRRARVEGFIVLDYMDRAPEAVAQLSQWLARGLLQYRVDVVQGLESAPSALNRLFDGTNRGKLIVKVSPEP